MVATLTLDVPCPADYDLASSLRTLWWGPRDPMMRVVDSEVCRATRTPRGPATWRARRTSSGVTLQVWGPGASWVAEHAPELLGLCDRPEQFVPTHRLVRQLWRRYRGLYLPRTLRVFEGLIPIVLQQLVTFREAMRAYGGLVRRFGEAAPGPGDLWLPPSAATMARLPDYALTPVGMLSRQARTLRHAAERAPALERLAERAPAEARRTLESLPGIGPWTSGLLSVAVMGDPDAVVLGDYHLPHQMCWALAGEPEGSDARMVELLEPFCGHRWRAVVLLRRGGPRRPRRGPRRGMRPLPRA